MRVIDLFAGCGGLSHGFVKAGYMVGTAVEFDPVIANTYKMNHPNVDVIVDDIKNVSKPTKTIASPKTYEEEVERKIESMETINTGFYSRELHGEDFEYTPKQKIAVKRKILESLPTVDSIMKVNK